MISSEGLKEVLSKEYKKHLTFYDNDRYLGVYINKENIFSLIKKLKDFEKLKFNQLMDITAIDYPSREIRFDVVYILLSLNFNKRIVVKTSVNVNETICKNYTYIFSKFFNFITVLCFLSCRDCFWWN